MMSNFFNPHSVITTIGAAAGAYTQVDAESATGATAAAAIGAYTGHKLSGSIMDTYGALKPQKISLDALKRSEVDISKAKNSMLSESRDSVNSIVNSLTHKLRDDSFDASTLRTNLSGMINNSFDGLSNHQLTYALDAYTETIGGDRKKLLEYRDVLKNDQVIQSVRTGERQAEQVTSVAIKKYETRAGIQTKLEKHFMEVLNNPEHIAREKAAQLAPVLKGRNARIDDFSMRIGVVKDGKQTTVPISLVGNTDSGTMFTRSNGIDFPERGFNPFAHLMQEGKTVTINKNGVATDIAMSADGSNGTFNATKKYHADQKLGLLNVVTGKITDEDIINISESDQKTRLYSATDSLSPIRMGDKNSQASGYAKRISGTVDLNTTFKYITDSETGEVELKLRSLNTRIAGSDQRSDFSKFINMVASKMGYNPLENQGTSSLGMITAPENIGDLYTAGHLNAEARGASSVNLRDHIPKNMATSEYLESIESTTSGVSELRKSASTGSRIHISEALGNSVSDLFSDTYAFDDGHGLANPTFKDKFTSTQMTRVSIGNTGDDISGRYNMSLDLPEGSTSSGRALDMTGLLEMSKPDRQLWLENNAVNVDNKQILGYDESNRAARLSPQFNEGRLIDVNIKEGRLDLILDGSFTPHDSTKIFGVSSKSGLTLANETNSFERIGSLALSESRGHFSSTINADGVAEYTLKTNLLGKAGSVIGAEELFQGFDKALYSGDKTAKGMWAEAGRASLMQRWEEIGQGGIEDILYGDEKSVAKHMEGLKGSLKGKGLDKYISEMDAQDLSETGRARRAAIFRSMTVISGDKAGQDIFMTAAEHAIRTGDQQSLETIRMLDSNSGGNMSNKMDEIIGVMEKTFKGNEGRSYTIFSPNIGEAIHGAGNTGSMSWIELNQLKSVGYDEDIINSMTASNRGALYELSMIHNSGQNGNFNKASFKSGSDITGALSSVFHIQADKRLSYLQEHGLNSSVKHDSLMYSLSNDSNGIKSVGIGLEETGLSGLKEHNGKKILLELEKARSGVIQADMALSATNTSSARKLAQTALDNSTMNLIDLQGLATSGDNDLVKEAAKRVATGSKFLTARPIGGSADDFAKGYGGVARAADGNPLVGFISKSMAKEMYSDMGIQNIDKYIVPSTTAGISFLKMPTGHNLMAQTSREPAQGPGSSIGRTLMISDSVDSTSKHIYIPKSETILPKFAYMDYDYDHLRVLPTLGLESEQMTRYQKKNQQMIQSLETMLGVQDNIKVKGNVKHMNVSTQFKDSRIKAISEMQSGELIRIRKVDSPDVTRLVTEMNLALDMTSKKGDPQIMERVLAHGLTENLLKSSHKATDSPLRGPLQDLLEAQKSFRSGGIDDSDYSKIVHGILDDTLGGQMDKATRSEQKMYRDGLRSLVDAHVSSDKTIARDGEIMLSQIQEGVTKFQKQQSNLNARLAAGAVSTKRGQIDVDSSIKGGKKMYNMAQDAIGKFKGRNAGVLGMAAAGIAGITIATRDSPEQLGMATPGGERGEPLAPLANESIQIRKYNPEKNYNISASVVSSVQNVNGGSIDRALFGDSDRRVAVNITDKSGMF